MTKKVFNLSGGKHSDAAYAAFENRLYGSCKASAASFVVSAGSGMNANIAAGDGLISTGTSSARRIQSTATESVAVAAASASFNRIDSVVAYIDNGVTPSTGVVDNTNDVLKFASVAGTAAATPTAPSGATIQAAIGSGNPYMILANVLVPQSAANLSGATFTNMAPVAIDKTGWIFDSLYTWLYASATSFTVNGVDVTAQFPAGTRLRISQGGTVKYFVVKSSSFSTNTTVVVDGGPSYTLTNVAIDFPAFSYEFAPQGLSRLDIQTPIDGYVEIGRATLTGAADAITISSLPAKKFLKIVANVIPSGSVNLQLKFNNDGGANYAQDFAIDYASTPATIVSASLIELEGSSGARQEFMVFDIVNISNQSKIGIQTLVHDNATASAATAPQRFDNVFKWNNTSSQITRVDLLNTGSGSTGDMAAGSEMVIYGRN